MNIKAFDTILQKWRSSLPASISPAYFDAFVVRQRATLEAVIGAWLDRRAARRERESMAPAAPESQTVKKRTERNIRAMQLVATKRPDAMSADERRAVLGYSGWGGLSIEGVADQFPPGLVPNEFALIHEYYTPVAVAEAIADLVCPLLPELAGLDGVVRALEPTVGIGRLVRAMGPPRCLPDDHVKEVRWTAVELSQVSAKMFAAMRPDVELFEMSVEKWMAEQAPRYQGTLGLILANPPYGQRGEYALQDKNAHYNEKAAYAYVMRRCLDLLVPRGLAVFLIPAGFLDGTTSRKLREKVLLRHHLEVAFRLPSEGATGRDTFPGAGNVVDVLVWRARGGELQVPDPDDAFILDGDYFQHFPEHVLGVEHGKADATTRAAAAAAKAAGEKPKRQRYRVVGDFTGFPAFTPRSVCRSCAIRNTPALEVLEVDRVVRDTNIDDDASDDLRVALELGRRVDQYLALVAAEDPRALNLWSELTQALESFRQSPGLRAHGGNPWKWPELRALESRRSLAARLLGAYQKGGELAPALASPPTIRPKFNAAPSDVAAQADYLFRSRRRLTIAELEAFHRSQGGVLSREAMLEALLPGEWNLDGEDWDQLVPARAYLNGMLWPKFDRAAARADDPQAQKQMRRLHAVMDLASFEDVNDVSPRQGWVPLTLVSAWMTETINARYGAVELARFGGTVQLAAAGDTLRAYEQLGTSNALTPETLWCVGWMNHDFTFFKPDLSPSAIEKLKEEDLAATGETLVVAVKEDDDKGDDEEEDDSLAIVRLLLGRHWDRDFVSWVKGDDDRKAIIAAAYNRAFRGVVIPSYEGDALEIARWNEAGPQLKDHQLAGARRVLDLRRGLVAFDVGVGKTFTAIAIVAAARQDGWVRRPVVLVPSSLVWKWAADFGCVLPDYRVCVIGSNRKVISRGERKGLVTSDTDTPEERAQKWSEFQAGLYDVVVLSYDALSRTKMNSEALLAYLDTIEGIKRQIKLRQRNAEKKKSDKLTERDRAILKHGARAFVEEMLELPKGHKFDPGIAWDDIGIDMLVVDEAANFKNSYKPEAREHGMPKFMGGAGEGAKRAWQLDFRAAAVRQRTGGSGVVLLTATPAKNSPLEFYNLIQLIDPYAFSTKGLMDPEQFIDRFLMIRSREIIDMTLRTKVSSCVDGFKNLDDLRTVIQMYGEFRSGEEVGLKMPQPISEQVQLPLGPLQEEAYSQVSRKLDQALSMAGRPGGQSQNKILGLMTRLGLIALHHRLASEVDYSTALQIDPDEYASPKLEACAERIAATAGCGHIIFCDNTAVHLWMREVLVKHRVPRERIAILNAIETQSADRVRIAREFNGISTAPAVPGSCGSSASSRVPPKYDVVIANMVAYEGIDLQTRTCTIHHLDLPWTPADLEQRNGRAVRQGNELPVVKIYYYLSDRTMDWYRYQLIQGKRAWLGAILQGQARDTSNPGAQEALSTEEIMMMNSRDPEATARAFAARKENLAQQARFKVAREAANLLAQANARFRDARDSSNPEEAARLRTEGEERLTDLRRADATAWPWAKWVDRVRDTEVMVASPTTPPVFEGLRVRTSAGVMEFGRILQGKIGRRMLGAPIWDLMTETQITALHLQPADMDAEGSEADLEDVLNAHVDRILGRRLASFEDLEWTGASDAWLTSWWPQLSKSIQESLSHSTAEEAYPVEVRGSLMLLAGEELQDGQLIPPTRVGWERFLELAPRSELKVGALRTTAERWWQRKAPRGFLAQRGEPTADAAGAASPQLPEDVQAPEVRALEEARPRAGLEAVKALQRRLNLMPQGVRVGNTSYHSPDVVRDATKTQLEIRFRGQGGGSLVLIAAPRQGDEIDLRGELTVDDDIVAQFGWTVMDRRELVMLKETSLARWFNVETTPEPKLSPTLRDALAKLKAEEDASDDPVAWVSWDGVHGSNIDALLARGLAIVNTKGTYPRYRTTAAGRVLLHAAQPSGGVVEDSGTAPKRARKPKATAATAAPAVPASRPPPDPTWAENLVDGFNASPGPRLRFEGATGRGNSAGRLFSVLREDSDEQLAVVEVVGYEVDEIRWLDARLRPSQQDAITDRLARLLAADVAREEARPSSSTSLAPLMRMLERQGEALNVDLVRARQVRPTGVHGLAVALQDLSTKPNTSPSELATHFNDVGLFKVAEVLEDESAVAYSSVAEIINKVWEAADEVVPLVEVMLSAGDKVVDARAVVDGQLLVREEARAGRKYTLHSATVTTAEHLEPNVEITSGEVPVGAKVYLLRDDDSTVRRTAGAIRDLHDCLTDLEHTLRKAPELLTDVRHLLFLAGALIETEKCQGREQKAALRAFEQAKHHYDAARRMLVIGKPAAAANKVHEAMRRIATSAAHISQSCAAGQQALLPATPAALSVSQADQEALEEASPP